MKSLSKQASDIGYVYSIRLDAKRYYDRLRRYVVRDRLLSRLESAIDSVTGATPGFAELLEFDITRQTASAKAATVLDRIDEQLFGVDYTSPDTGFVDRSKELIGIPQGPVLSAWIGTVSLFPVDEVAYRFMDQLNTDSVRVGYARYVDDIVLMADDPSLLMEMRESIDCCARMLQLTLVPKADEIPPMSAEDFSIYINQGRALAASGPAWEPPLVGDGESGWEFWSVSSIADRQSALQLLHNVELYKALPATLINTVKTAFSAPDLRASELSKAARLIWYAIASNHSTASLSPSAEDAWKEYLQTWSDCLRGASWQLQPDKNVWESPLLFALEGLEHLLDTTSRDVAELSSTENMERRHRIAWLAKLVLEPGFRLRGTDSTPYPEYQTKQRFRLVRWKAMRIVGRRDDSAPPIQVEQSKLVEHWRPFEWLHEAVALLSEATQSDEDPLQPFIGPTENQTRRGAMSGVSAAVFRALLPGPKGSSISSRQPVESLEINIAAGIALQTIVSVVPRDQLLNCLNRRPQLIWKEFNEPSRNRLVLPPLPGMSTARLFSCLGKSEVDRGFMVANSMEVIGIASTVDPRTELVFHGGNGNSEEGRLLSPEWREGPLDSAGNTLYKLDADLGTNQVLRLREQIQTVDPLISGNVLKQAATLFRAIAQVVLNYSEEHTEKELVPAWPYIAGDASDQFYYLIGEGVSRFELGNRAFVRDGGRALRTIEVPIFEASLWRAGIAISDYLGFCDDIAKFSNVESDLTLDSAALADPARYVLRAQLRKLRGAYADSNISKQRSSVRGLPSSVERSLRLLESFPTKDSDANSQLVHVLTAEAESTGMFLSFRERWECADVSSFLRAMAERVFARLPLSVGEMLATGDETEKGLRRDFAGLLCFSRSLFKVKASAHGVDNPAWDALCASVVCTGISVAIDGLISSLRSHGEFEQYTNFDFPIDWEIVSTQRSQEEQEAPITAAGAQPNRSLIRVSLVEQLRRLLQHLGHRLQGEQNSPEKLSDQLFDQFKLIATKVHSIEAHGSDVDELLDWPFRVLSPACLELLNLDLLESVGKLISQIDKELGLEVELVTELSYGYNGHTRRFTDSRNGVCEVTPWMISQFPRTSKHIEEIDQGGRFLRVWSEVFDRKTGKLLSVAVLGEPFASIAIKKSQPVLVKPNETIERANGEPLVINDTERSAAGNSVDSSLSVGVTQPGLRDDTSASIPSQASSEDAPLSSPNPSETHTGNLNKPLSNTQATADVGALSRAANSFMKMQADRWESRGERPKPEFVNDDGTPDDINLVSFGVGFCRWLAPISAG